MNRIFTVILLSITISSLAQEKKETQNNWELNGYFKQMQVISFADIEEEWTTDNLIHNRLNFKWYASSSITMGVEMRNRLIYGESVKSLSDSSVDYSSFIDIDNGILDLSQVWMSKKSFLLHSAIDRAWLDYTKGKWEIRVGRQRINWGQTFVWNPNDLFNTYSFFDFDYEEKPGSDAVRIQYYTGATSKIELAVKANQDNKITAAGLVKINKWNCDFQFIGGILDEKDLVLGTGWSGSLFKGGFRGEATYFHPKDNLADTSGTFLMSIGYDYTFKNSLFIQAEVLYNQNGKKESDFDLNEFYYQPLSAKNLSLTKLSFFGQASYPITPLLSGSFSAMYSPNDNSVYFGPSIALSLRDDLELYIGVQTFLSDQSKDEDGRGTFAFVRLRWSF